VENKQPLGCLQKSDTPNDSSRKYFLKASSLTAAMALAGKSNPIVAGPFEAKDAADVSRQLATREQTLFHSTNDGTNT